MRPAHPRERAIGIEHYVSAAEGVGGRLRERPGDFRVREIEAFDPEPPDADPDAYPHLVLRATLRGWDTNDFAGRLSDALGISRERVSWAGTKDKHAVTTQLFTVRDVDPGRLPRVDDAEIEVLGRAGREIAFGDLAGNEFEIRVRNPERPGNADAITGELRAFAGADGSGGDGGDGGDSCDGGDDGEGGTGDDGDREREVGVPNYFGQQRFGSLRPVTHEVGLHVVRGEWRKAVLSYVGNPHDAEPEDTRAARAFADRQAAGDDPDWAAAIERMPGRLGYERAMLQRLREADAGSDAESAVWRRALEAVPSNLQRLFVNAAQSYAFNRILSERLRRGLPFLRPVAGDVVCFADRDAPEGLAAPDTDRLQRVTADRVETVARHCERGRAFVTAPLVGTGTELGDGEPGEIERAVLDDLNLAPEDFDLPGAFDSAGTRRAVLVRTAVTVKRDTLTLAFALPKGSYATVLLREYLKVDPLDL